MSNVSEFLGKHSLLPQSVDPLQCSVKMADHMRSGLEGRIIDMPMIPTYLKGIGSVVPGEMRLLLMPAAQTTAQPSLLSARKDAISQG